MSKILITTSLLTFFAMINLNAQLEVSVGGGLNISSVKIDNADIFNPDSRNGYYISVMPKISLNDNLKLNIEGQYSKEGFNYRDGTIDNERSITYFRFIPQIEFTLLNIIGIYSGINVGVKTSEKFKINGETVTGVMDAIKSNDFSIPFGVRAYISNFYANVSYNVGVSDISDINFTNDDGSIIEDAKIQNSHIQIGLGYTF